MIVAIDGPAGAGKSSLARRLASSLQFDFLDTGAMYRAVTLACLRRRIDMQDAAAIERCAAELGIQLQGDTVHLDGEDVSDEIRLPAVGQAIRPIADNPAVRERLIAMQRRLVAGRDFVTEGRDQGTVAFPEAECKIFLTASPQERAMRRQKQLAAAGVERSIDSILADQDRRDADDTSREHGGLRAAPDSIYVLTDGLGEDEVLDRLIEIVNGRRRGLKPGRPR